MSEEYKKPKMLDTLHKCLMCNAKAYEYDEGRYVCSNNDCEFTWRVKHCEK